MYNRFGWWFPDMEDHFPRMLEKSVTRGGPSEYQHQVRDRSLSYVGQRRVALDIGANVGLWSRSLVKNFEKVIAFEPVAIFRECLLKNVTADNLEVKTMALGDQNTTATMNLTPGNTGHTHIDPTSFGAGTTQVSKLDDLDIANIDYIKIDCEGFEYRVLLGAKQTVMQWRPVIVVEQKPHDIYSQDYGQFAAVDLLKSWGMRRLDQVKDDWIMGW